MSHLIGVGCCGGIPDHSTVRRLGGNTLFFFLLDFLQFALFEVKMVGAAAYDEMLLGFTADGMFEIILRPGKFFFFRKNFFFKFCSLSNFFKRFNV